MANPNLPDRFVEENGKLRWPSTMTNVWCLEISLWMLGVPMNLTGEKYDDDMRPERFRRLCHGCQRLNFLESRITLDFLVSGFVPPEMDDLFATRQVPDNNRAEFVAVVHVKTEHGWRIFIYHPASGMILPNTASKVSLVGQIIRDNAKSASLERRQNAVDCVVTKGLQTNLFLNRNTLTSTPVTQMKVCFVWAKL